MDIPEGLEKHQADYKKMAWNSYTDEELQWWVKLLTKRATHRSNPEKAEKDLYDAANYQSILDARGG